MMLKKRKRVRLKYFDYRSANSYFVTICVRDKICSLGRIKGGIMGYSDIGNAAAFILQSNLDKRPDVELDEFVIMPNHIHCIINIKKGMIQPGHSNKFGKPLAGSLSIIINQFKGAVKKWCIKNGYRSFEWQTNFHEHVIRNNNEYWVIKNYIINNPRNWQKDKWYFT